jgi:anti-sigma factor RsiW
MNHDQHQKRISLYVDHSLSDAEAAKLFAHLSRCKECRTFLTVTLGVHAHIAEERLEEVPQSLDRRVLADVAAAARPTEADAWYAPVWFTRISIPLPAAASILFLIIVGSLLFSPILAQPPQQQTEIPPQLVAKIPASLQQLPLNK